ncbi:hypothetical protein Javan306_0035 [Streptococcus phage Javan306]|uniref:hypothetical protein n=1 Tax=Streptococcus mitis TaxID=28037 RepID=UPI00098A03DD|nr:hypothetical protein [Streptococcus mitis]QBX26153.1 hypothetical protein Javan306_0035 [Streptococcus phage Javan306]
MKYDKQAVIDGKKHAIEVLEKRIVELSKPCLPKYRHLRAAERDLLRKKVKQLKKELEDDGRVKAKS